MKRTQTNPRSLANLCKLWQPGQSGNLNGLPANYTSPAHWLRTLSTWTEPKLVALVSDQNKSVSQRLAGRALLDGLYDNADVRGRAYDRLNDRLEGRPKQGATITIEKREPTTQELLDQYRARSGSVRCNDVMPITHDEQAPEGVEHTSENTDTPPDGHANAVVADGVGK